MNYEDKIIDAFYKACKENGEGVGASPADVTKMVMKDLSEIFKTFVKNSITLRLIFLRSTLHTKVTQLSPRKWTSFGVASRQTRFVLLSKCIAKLFK